MSVMVERVAREIRFVMYGVPPQRPFDVDSFWLVYAKAAIQAMRDPTSEMASAGFVAYEDSFLQGSEGIEPFQEAWRAMIDEALK